MINGKTQQTKNPFLRKPETGMLKYTKQRSPPQKTNITNKNLHTKQYEPYRLGRTVRKRPSDNNRRLEQRRRRGRNETDCGVTGKIKGGSNSEEIRSLMG
jgi:hypothetical protein